MLIGFLSIAAVFMVYMRSGMDEVHLNGFNRKRNVILPSLLHALDLKYKSYYISGLSNVKIYLGNRIATSHLLTSNYAMNDTSQTYLPFAAKNVYWPKVNLSVNFPDVYLTEYQTPRFITAKLPFSAEQVRDIAGIQFDDVKVISAHSLIVRRFDPDLRQKVLRKIGIENDLVMGPSFKPTMQMDGSFSIDGFMFYNKQSAKLFYTYYYRNQFVCLDTNMNLLYTASTIDSNQFAKLKISTIKKEKSTETVFAAPPIVVNKQGYSFGSWIYMNSALQADNDSRRDFEGNSIIDVYSSEDGKYYGSLYLPNYAGNKISDFAVYGNILVAISGNFLLSYKIL